MVETVEKTWTNCDNHAFYDDMPLNFFISGAIRSGVANGEDVQKIKDIILKTQSILEIGAGYGRILKSIIEIGYTGALEAIEYDRRYYNFCVERYGHKARLYHANVLEWRPQKTYDLITWMWSSIAEFSKHEQTALLDKFSQWLTPQGCLVVETLKLSKKDKDRLIIDGQDCLMIYDRPGGYLYVPTQAQLTQYAEKKLKLLEVRPYLATGEVERSIYIFKKISF